MPDRNPPESEQANQGTPHGSCPTKRYPGPDCSLFIYSRIAITRQGISFRDPREPYFKASKSGGMKRQVFDCADDMHPISEFASL
jgi:hypothetical protein